MDQRNAQIVDGKPTSWRPIRSFWRRVVSIFLHERCSPLELGAGVALGTMVGMTPFYGMHLGIALMLAALLRVNLAGAALATQISNPLLAPILIVASVRLGVWLGFGAGSFQVESAQGLVVFRAWLVGGLILGVASGLILGLITGGTRAYLIRRRSRAS